MKVAILGAGNWGTTLSIMLSKRVRTDFKPALTLWTIEKIERRENKKYLPGYEIPDEVEITESLDESTKEAELLIFALPSQVMREVAKQVGQGFSLAKSEAILLSVTKGIENHSLKRMSEILKEETGVPCERICVLSGPTIAREVVKEFPTSCVSASVNENNARVVQKLFNSPRFRVYTSTDVIGVELGGALKNIIALAAGICDGLGLGVNAKGSLLTRGIREITRLGTAMGADPITFAGLSGIGDLITTAFSEYSRNRNVGELIGRGMPLNKILEQMAEVAEGVSTTLSAVELSKQYEVPLPITHQVYEILFNNKSPSAGMSDLMSRELKPETV